MDYSYIILIAIGLSMDTFAVSLSNGLVLKNLSLLKILSIGFVFSLFQSIMPFLGWLAGTSIEKYIVDFDHWIAFGLLAFIGTRMIYDASKNDNYNNNNNNELKINKIILQAIATSIDALAVGISLGLLNVNIAYSVIIIGFTTLFFAVSGLYIGKLVRNKIQKFVEYFGGIILIIIGIKILIEHLA
ncbi:MAG: manganese efflux pump MntP family protein [Marinilabiliales bacterium]